MDSDDLAHASPSDTPSRERGHDHITGGGVLIHVALAAGRANVEVATVVFNGADAEDTTRDTEPARRRTAILDGFECAASAVVADTCKPVKRGVRITVGPEEENIGFSRMPTDRGTVDDPWRECVDPFHRRTVVTVDDGAVRGREVPRDDKLVVVWGVRNVLVGVPRVWKVGFAEDLRPRSNIAICCLPDSIIVVILDGCDGPQLFSEMSQRVSSPTVSD